MTANEMRTVEYPLLGLLLFLLPAASWPYLLAPLGLTLEFDKLTLSFVSVNLATYLAFRLLVFSRIEEITGIGPLKQLLETLSTRVIPKGLTGKTIPDAFSIDDIAKYSRAKILIEVTEEEVSVIRRDWLFTMFGFILTAGVASAIGFGEILKPLTPQKSAFLTIAFATCVFHFWWPLFEVRFRND